MTTDIDKTIDDAKAAVLPFESWDRLAGESSAAYAAFCAFRDYGPDRNIRKAAEGQFHKAGLPGGFPPEEKTPRANLEVTIARKYGTWRAWATQFRWRERAADYDRHLDRLKQTEQRKTIEEREAAYRETTGKMLQVVNKKLDLMNPAELTQGNVAEWVGTAVRTEREIGQFADANYLGVSTGRNSMPKQLEIQFTPEFEGL
jgi:hypothetical protein